MPIVDHKNEECRQWLEDRHPLSICPLQVLHTLDLYAQKGVVFRPENGCCIVYFIVDGNANLHAHCDEEHMEEEVIIALSKALALATSKDGSRTVHTLHFQHWKPAWVTDATKYFNMEGYRQVHRVHGSTAYLPGTAELPEVTPLPAPFVVGPLRPADADLINDYWPHKSEESHSKIKFQIEKFRSLGIYDGVDGPVIAWMMETDYGGIGVLNVVEKFRRRGLAEHLANMFVRLVRGKDSGSVGEPFCGIAHGNAASENLFFKKLSFAFVDDTSLCTLSKKSA